MEKRLLLTLFVVAIFFNVPAAYAYMQVVSDEERGYASCFVYELQNEDGSRVVLPKRVDEAFDCPFMKPLLSPDQTLLLFSDEWGIKMYNFSRQKTALLLKLRHDKEGVSFTWSPQGSRVACVITDQMNYPDKTKIFLFRQAGTKFKLTKIVSRAVQFSCGSHCGAELPWFEDENTLRYIKYSPDFPEQQNLGIITF